MSSQRLDPSLGQLDFKLSASVNDTLDIVCAAIVVTLAVVIWAVFYRKKHRRRLHRHHHQQQRQGNDNPGSPSSAESPTEPARSHLRKQGSWRRSKHRDRPMNPTLAQTRGLPPLRDESTPPAAP